MLTALLFNGLCGILGTYVVLFTASVVLLLRRARTQSLNVPIFIANLLLFASCTAHFALEFDHFYTTLVSSSKISRMHAPRLN